MSIHLVVKQESLTKRGDDRPVWGQVWLEGDGFEFPDEGWTDLAVVFCLSWLRALREIESGEATEVLVHFMDGPFQVKLHTSEKNTVVVEMIDRRAEDNPARTVSAATEMLRRNARMVAESILQFARRNRWRDTDLTALAAAVTDADR